MLLDKQRLSAMVLRAADVWQDNIPLLGEIDSRFGDGDHGVTIGKIANCLRVAVEGWETQTVGGFLEAAGKAVMAVGGGSAGPLYGTLIGDLACPLGAETTVDGAMLKRMLAASRDGMFAITKARVGDKTMMDALIPAVEAALAAPDEPEAILSAAAKAAGQGAAATEGYVSKFGRARSYGEKTLGTRDAGACSTALLFQGLHEGLFR